MTIKIKYLPLIYMELKTRSKEKKIFNRFIKAS